MTITLVVHPERGWLINTATGIVYGAPEGNYDGIPIGTVGTHGYLVTTRFGRAYLMHRVVWEACVGPIPAGHVVNHKNGIKTDNRLANLEAITAGENQRHAYETGLKRRLSRPGPLNGNYRIDRDQHAAILARLASGETGVSLAQEFGVSPKTISRIRTGERCAT